MSSARRFLVADVFTATETATATIAANSSDTFSLVVSAPSSSMPMEKSLQLARPR